MPASSSEDRLNSVEPPAEEWTPDRPEYQAFARFAQATRAARQAEAHLKKLKEELETMKLQLRDCLGQNGWELVRVEGFSIHLRRDLYVHPRAGVTGAEVIRALKENDMGHFVREEVARASISEHLRELEDRYADLLESGQVRSVAELMPPEIAALLDCEPKWTVVAMESRGRRR